MVRTNAALLGEAEHSHLIDAFVRDGVTVVVSLPCYTQDNVDRQRGAGNFDRVLAGIRALNAAGYAREPGLELNLVYNPLGAYLPGSQESLQEDYRRELGENAGVAFDNLFCLANTPLGRFRDSLERKGELASYLTLLYENFNPSTLAGMMCRSQLNVDYDGRLYDCEMNHVIGLPIHGEFKTIGELRGHRLGRREIMFNGGCYVCTAGSGSSCGGSLV
jgi:radical SAM/Cys-rich protein